MFSPVSSLPSHWKWIFHWWADASKQGMVRAWETGCNGYLNGKNNRTATKWVIFQLATFDCQRVIYIYPPILLFLLCIVVITIYPLCVLLNKSGDQRIKPFCMGQSSQSSVSFVNMLGNPCVVLLKSPVFLLQPPLLVDSKALFGWLYSYTLFILFILGHKTSDFADMFPSSPTTWL